MSSSFDSVDHNSLRPPNFNQEEIDLHAIGGSSFWLDRIFTVLVYILVAVTVGVLFYMSWIIFQQAEPAILKFGLGFLWSKNWDSTNEDFGALPYIYGTLVSSFIAIFLAVPVGLSIAIVTSENFLSDSLKNILAFIVELIAAIPSVIIGLWAIFIFIPVVQPIEQWLSVNLKIIPLFNTTDPAGNNMLTAGIILAIMILPTMASVSREVLLVIPPELRSASMALGSTRWETIFRVIFPAAFSGIVSAAMLALGRALGETMAVTMVIGNSAQVSASFLDPAYTIPAVLANEFAEAEFGSLHVGALCYLGLMLFALTLVINFIAVLLIQLVGSKNA